MRRRIPEPISLAPDKIIKTKNGSGAEILEAGNMTQMVGVLQQLGLLATYSHGLFYDATIIQHLHPPLAHLHRLSLQAELKAKKAARRAAGGGGGKAAAAKRKAKAIKKKRFMTEAVQLVESAVCPA